jgi:hypothetical protein
LPAIYCRPSLQEPAQVPLTQQPPEVTSMGVPQTPEPTQHFRRPWLAPMSLYSYGNQIFTPYPQVRRIRERMDSQGGAAAYPILRGPVPPSAPTETPGNENNTPYGCTSQPQSFYSAYPYHAGVNTNIIAPTNYSYRTPSSGSTPTFAGEPIVDSAFGPLA